MKLKLRKILNKPNNLIGISIILFMVGLYQFLFWGMFISTFSSRNVCSPIEVIREIPITVTSENKSLQSITINTQSPTSTIAPIILPSATSTTVPENTNIPITEVSIPTNIPQPICDCSADIYNCNNIPQGCFDYCVEIGAGDIHKLDRDNDGFACEGN